MNNKSMHMIIPISHIVSIILLEILFYYYKLNRCKFYFVCSHNLSQKLKLWHFFDFLSFILSTGDFSDNIHFLFLVILLFCDPFQLITLFFFHRSIYWDDPHYTAVISSSKVQTQDQSVSISSEKNLITYRRILIINAIILLMFPIAYQGPYQIILLCNISFS